MDNWTFDLISALIGAGAMLLLVGLLYSQRRLIFRVGQQIRGGVQHSIDQVAAGVEGAYRRAVVSWAQQAHALTVVGSLEQLFVAPDVLPPLSQATARGQDLPPRLPLSLSQALQGHQRLLIAGELGCGRSMLLAYLALVHAQQQAVARLELPTERLPIYLHLADLDQPLPVETPAAVEESAATAEPSATEESTAAPPSVEQVKDKAKEKAREKELDDLSRLVQRAVHAVGASVAGGVLRKYLADGRALILLDGWDELTPAQQEQVAVWLERLLKDLPGNMWLVAVGPRGFGPLTALDFVPLRLQPWNNAQIESLIDHLAAQLTLTGENAELRLHETRHLLQRIVRDAHVSRLELVLRAWLKLARGEMPRGRLDVLVQAMEQLLSLPAGEDGGLPTPIRAVLGNLALTLQQESRITVTRAEIEAVVDMALPPVAERQQRAMTQVMQTLTAGKGPLVSRGGDRYAFAHLLWQAALVARQTASMPSTTLVERVNDARWWPVLDFYAEIGQMEPILKAWLTPADDLWRTRLRMAARWAALAPPDVQWRSGVMALLARAFLAPAPAAVRGALAVALARTGDAGVPYFLRQASKHPQESVRVAAVHAMGLLYEKADLAVLMEALQDLHDDVREAAALALGGIGTPPVLRSLERALHEGDDALRMDAARGLARVGEEGWDVLREAIRADDFLTRRAAAHGLGTVGQPWARESLEWLAREDPEWIVRSAATTVLGEAETTAEPPKITAAPLVSEIPWLNSWAASRGGGVAMGEAAFVTLVQALEEGDPPIRQAAAQTLGLVARPEHAAVLRQALNDSDADVAQTAYDALVELAERYDLYVQ